MKLTYKNIPGFLANPKHNCIGTLIYGADDGQVHETAAGIAKFIVEDVRDPFSVAELSDDMLKSNPATLSDELFALNMMGGQRLVKVNSSQDSVGKLITQCFDSDTLPEAYLLVTAGELTPRSPLRSFFEAHPKLAALPCYRDEIRQISTIIRQTFTEAGIAIDREAQDYLSANLGNDRGVTRSELEKIVLYCGEEKKLSLEQAKLLVGGNTEINLDDLCHAVAGGQVKPTETILHRHLKEGIQPVQLTRALQRYFQKLHLLTHQMKQQKISADQAIAALKPKVFFRTVPLMRQHLSFWSRDGLQSALESLTSLEQRIKETGSSPALLLDRSVTDLLLLGHRGRRA